MALGFLDDCAKERALIIMEGASSLVIALGDGWVRKIQKRSARKGRASIAEQVRLQMWAATHLATAGGKLFSPRVRESLVPNSYEMEIVETEVEPFFLCALPPGSEEEVAHFQAAFERETGNRLWDVEFYVQKDGRIAVLDFDQCLPLKK